MYGSGPGFTVTNSDLIVSSLHDHLLRLGLWALFSLLLAMALSRRHGVSREFALMTAGWAIINLAIVGFSWNGKPPELAPFREFLMLNLGLNVGYIGVGLTMALAGKPRARLIGFGWAIALQGIALLAFDGLLLVFLPNSPGP